MPDLPHNSIEAIEEEGGCKLDGGYEVDASLTAAATRMQDRSRWQRGHKRLKTTSGGGYKREGERVEYRTLGANPVVL